MSEAATTTTQNESAIVLSSKPIRGIIPGTYDEAVRMSKAVYEGAVSIPKGITNAQGVFTIMQTGMEIGLTPMQALQGMHIINGKVGMSGDLMLALALDNPNCEYAYGDCDKTDPNNWKGWFVSKRRGPYPEKRTEFTQADALRAGLWNKKGYQGAATPWQTYPDRMLYYRAMGFNLRDNFPDAFKLLKSIEELRDYPDAEPQQAITDAPEVQRSAPQTAAQTPVSKQTVDADFEDQPPPSKPNQQPASEPHPMDELESRHQGTDNVALTKVDLPVLELFGLNKQLEHNGNWTNVIVSGASEPIDVAIPAEVYAKCVNGDGEQDTKKAYKRKNALAFTQGGYKHFIQELLSYNARNPKPEDQAAVADAEEEYLKLEHHIEEAELALQAEKHAAFADARNIDVQRKRKLGTANLKEAPLEKLHQYLTALLSALEAQRGNSNA